MVLNCHPRYFIEAARVRKEYDESSAKLSKIESRISKLSDKLQYDFGEYDTVVFFLSTRNFPVDWSLINEPDDDVAGQDKEFYSFYGRCFESKQNK